MIRLKQRKGLCPTVEDKKLWSKSIFCKILNKAKTSETAKTRKKVVVKVSRRDGVYN